MGWMEAEGAVMIGGVDRLLLLLQACALYFYGMSDHLYLLRGVGVGGVGAVEGVEVLMAAKG